MIKLSRKDSLFKTILKDLVFHYKLPILLIAAIIFSAFSIVTLTNKVRQQAYEKNQIVLEIDGLKSEWNSLILEENTLTSNKIIEDKARSIGMDYIDIKSEVIIAKP